LELKAGKKQKTKKKSFGFDSVPAKKQAFFLRPTEDLAGSYFYRREFLWACQPRSLEQIF